MADLRNRRNTTITKILSTIPKPDCSFYDEPLRTWTKTNVKFAIWSYVDVKLSIQVLRKVYTVWENSRFLRCRFCNAIWRNKIAFENFSTVYMDKRALRSKIWRARTFETSWDFANLSKWTSNAKVRAAEDHISRFLRSEALTFFGGWKFPYKETNLPTSCFMLQFKGKNTFTARFDSSFK